MDARKAKRLKDAEQQALYDKASKECWNEWGLSGAPQQIGKGGFSRVYRAEREKGTVTAVKVCLLAGLTSRQQQYLFREVEVQRTLRDTYLVGLLNSYCTPDYVVIEMEYCEMTLKDYVLKNGITCTVYATEEGKKDLVLKVLDEKTLRPFARHAMLGLYHLNRYGYPHRDIKDENILLFKQPDGELIAKLADFGMSKPVDEGLNTSLGTPMFMAPEVILANKNRVFSKAQSTYDLRCDIWSMGITFYKILTGEYPYTRLTQAERVCNPEPKVISLPKTPRGSPDSGKFSEFSGCVKDFIQCLLTKDFTQRVHSDEALEHPYLMPTIQEMQLVVPDTHLNVFVCRPHIVFSGELAFNNAVKGSSLNDVLSRYPNNRMKWQATWKDFGEKIGLGTDDFLVVADNGNTFESCDRIPFSEENCINVAVVPRRSLVGRVDPAVLQAATKKQLDKMSKMKYSKETFDYYVKELNGRRSLCSSAERVSKSVLPLLNLTPITKRLAETQDKLVKRIPLFPVVAFVPPPKMSWDLTVTAEDTKNANLLYAAIKDAHSSFKEKMGNRRVAPDLQPEIERLRKLTEVWMGPELNPSLSHAVESFNNVLDVIRTRVEIINRLLDYIHVLESVKDKPTAAYPQIAALTEGCPYLQLSKKGERLVKKKSRADEEDDVVAQLKRQIDELSRIVEEQKEENRRLDEQNAALRQKARSSILSKRKVVIELRAALKKAHISDDP